MSTLVDAAHWSDNEVYEIDATDVVEGAHGGAPYGGIGVDNEPHQQLANRTAYLKGRVDDLAAAFAFVLHYATVNGVVGMPVNSYVTFPLTSPSGPAATFALQFGSVPITTPVGVSSVIVTPLPLAFGDGVVNRAITAWSWITQTNVTPNPWVPLVTSWEPELSGSTSLWFNYGNTDSSEWGVAPFVGQSKVLNYAALGVVGVL